jgi:regulator of protease activity HflC (stomatin/prohibitin superfamily)
MARAFPGLAITVTVLAFNLLGDGIRGYTRPHALSSGAAPVTGPARRDRASAGERRKCRRAKSRRPAPPTPVEGDGSMKPSLVLVGLIAWLVSGCGFTSSAPGEGVVFARFGDVDMKCYPAGFYLYNPFTTSVYHVDVKVQKIDVKADASSRDLQTVTTTIVVNFSIDANKCHELIKNVGIGFAQQIILPAVEEVTKASTALFPVEKVIQERPKLKKEIEDGLKVRLSPYWITVQAVSITNITFSRDFSHAIEQKQVEEQNVQRAEFVRQQAEKEGQRQLALAEGQAKANRLLQESLKSSPEVLQMKALDKWDGKLPQYMGSGSVPFIRLEQGK